MLSFRTVFTKNNLPSKVLDQHSQYKLLYDRVLDYQFLRVFVFFFHVPEAIILLSLILGQFIVSSWDKFLKNVVMFVLIQLVVKCTPLDM